MRLRFRLLILGIVCTPLFLSAADDISSGHEKTLSTAGVKIDSPSLLNFFKERTLSAKELARIEDLIRLMGSDTFAEREQATKDLIAAGRKVVPLLLEAKKNKDLEIVRRARRCLTVLDPTPDSDVVLAAANLLAIRKVPGAEETLLGYLPFLEDETIEEELFRVLHILSSLSPKPSAALLAALKNKSPRQRSAAGYVLGRSKKAEERLLVAPLLRDENARVRFRTAEGLIFGRDIKGVQVLVNLLGEGPVEQAVQAETLLALLATDKAPQVQLSEADEQRKKCQTAWQDWLKNTGGKIDFSKIDLGQAFLGLRLVAAYSGYGGGGAIWEYGSDRKQRWQVKNTGGAFDAHWLPGSKLLIAEYNDRRVSERDLTGKVLWEYKPNNGPLEIQRLTNGNTLIATNYEIIEVTRDGKTTRHHRDPGGNIFTAQKLPNGHLLFGLYSGWLIEMTTTGKEILRFKIESPRGLANILSLPNGRFVMPLAGSNRIVEMDRAGKVVREVKVTSPTCVALLPGGNYLVGSHILNNVREVDRNGKVLWEQKAEGQIFRVRTR